MSKGKSPPYQTERREQIIGRGVDALFSGAGLVKPSTTQDAEAISPANSPQLTASVTDEIPSNDSPKVVGEGPQLSDEEILQAINVPLGANDEPLTEPTPIPKSEEDISIDKPADEKPAPSPALTEPKPERIDSAEGPPTSGPQPQARVRISGPLTEVQTTTESSIRPRSPFRSEPFRFPESQESPPPRTPEENAAILARVSAKRVAELQHDIDRLYEQVPKTLSNRTEATSQILGMLRQARTILIERPVDFVEAEYKVQQAKSVFNSIENAEQWADKYGWRVFYYEVAIFVVFLLSFLSLLAFSQEFSGFLARLVGSTDPEQGILAAVGFWATFVWGGIGGVVGALYVLYTHVADRQDFQRQHVMWYIAQPLMGLILGGVTFLIINTGLLSLQGGQIAAVQMRTEVQLFPCLISFIAGFRPQFIFGLLTKVIKVISPGSEKEST